MDHEDMDKTGTLPVAGDAAVPVAGSDQAAGGERPAWVAEARAGLSIPGRYLAYEQDGRRVIVPVEREWTRIGRSLSADVRFDDATVSRRHALVALGPDGVRVLDDRSLNGIHVNGRRVEWSPLSDGDEVLIGRHSLYFLDTATVGGPSAGSPVALAE